MNPLIQRLKEARREADASASSAPKTTPLIQSVSEGRRIADLPIVNDYSVDLTEELRTPTGTMSLRPIQSLALDAGRRNEGGFFPIGVGHGKSLIALLMGTVMKSRCVIVFAPASTVGTMEKTLQDFSAHFRMPKNIHILSYAKLSRPEGTEILDKLRGDIPSKDVLIVCDECHRLKNKQASRTKRVVRWFKENEDARFIGLSGTITSKSIRDFSHLIALALRQSAPVPLRKDVLDLWAITLDVPNFQTDKSKDRLQRKGVNYKEKSMKSLAPLRKWGEKAGMSAPRQVRDVMQSLENAQHNMIHYYFDPRKTRGVVERVKKENIEFMRKCFGLRLRTCPGVVATSETSINTSLYIRRVNFPFVGVHDNGWYEHAAENNETPSEDPFDSDVAKWRCLRQLSWGFYLEWDWGDQLPDTDWLIARAGWRKALYQELVYKSKQGYDSPLLVTRQIQRDIEAGVGVRNIHHRWMDWDTQRHKPVPPTVAKWIDKTKYHQVLGEILKRKEPHAIWCDSVEMQDEARRMGIPVYGAGKEIPEHPHTAMLSISAHGIGKNLVQWSKASVLTWQSDGQATEQLLGRHHRPGQSADEVWFECYVHTPVLDKALRDSIKKAKYIESMTGNKQKILLATTVEP